MATQDKVCAYLLLIYLIDMKKISAMHITPLILFFYSIDEADSDDKSVISNSEEDKDDDSSPGMSMLII